MSLVAARLEAQAPPWLFPDRSLLPDLVAGPRDPASKALLLLTTDDPTAFGDGVGAEVAVGITLPVLLLAGETMEDALVVGVEAGAFARFTLQITERELVNTDWVFAVPIVWHRADHWLRLRYYHTSSHIGDEYSRRFEVPGDNFFRDAVDVLAFRDIRGRGGVYGGVGFAYNVRPEDSKRWTLRAGAQTGPPGVEVTWAPLVGVDVVLDQDTDWDPRIAVQAGFWLPLIRGRRAGRLVLELLTGPTPLGQFHGDKMTQFAFGVHLSL